MLQESFAELVCGAYICIVLLSISHLEKVFKESINVKNSSLPESLQSHCSTVTCAWGLWVCVVMRDVATLEVCLVFPTWAEEKRGRQVNALTGGCPIPEAFGDPNGLFSMNWEFMELNKLGACSQAALYVPDLCLLAGAICPSMDWFHPVLPSMRRCSELEPSLRVTLSVPVLGIVCSASPFSLWSAMRVPTLHHHLSFWLKKLKFTLWKGQFWCWWIPGTRFTQL